MIIGTLHRLYFLSWQDGSVSNDTYETYEEAQKALTEGPWSEFDRKGICILPRESMTLTEFVCQCELSGLFHVLTVNKRCELCRDENLIPITNLKPEYVKDIINYYNDRLDDTPIDELALRQASDGR
jgi:hypothetical protein